MTMPILALALALPSLLLFTQDPAYPAALAEVVEADTIVNTDFSAAPRLATALAALADFAPTLAEDPQALGNRTLARLNLARAYLSTEELELANAAMDEAIREAMGGELPVDLFGPILAEFHSRRDVALEARGRASLSIDCAIPCRVYVDETLYDASRPPSLLLGPYRVWVEDGRGVLPPERKLVVLDTAGEIVELRYGRAAPRPGPEPQPPTQQRHLPRWAEGLLIVAGLGLTATGASLLALNYVPSGAVSLGVGVAFSTGGFVTLAIDAKAVRAGRRRRPR